MLSEKVTKLLSWYKNGMATFENGGTDDRSFNVPITMDECALIKAQLEADEENMKANQSTDAQDKLAALEADFKTKKEALS